MESKSTSHSPDPVHANPKPVSASLPSVLPSRFDVLLATLVSSTVKSPESESMIGELSRSRLRDHALRRLRRGTCGIDFWGAKDDDNFQNHLQKLEKEWVAAGGDEYVSLLGEQLQ